MERLWRDHKEPLADASAPTIAMVSDAMCVIIQRYAPAPLPLLTHFTYFVHVVEKVQKALYGSLPNGNRNTASAVSRSSGPALI
jgi:hypothetical protein